MSRSVVVQKGPYRVELEAGKRYAWCACGRSTTQPYCDGSHKVTEIRPVVFTAEVDGEAWLCGCKTTGGVPFCDGSHDRS